MSQPAPSDPGHEPALTDSARLVLERRYLRRDDAAGTMETPSEMFRRVADAVSLAETAYGADASAFADRAFALMHDLRFLPNSPTLMNAGLPLQQLAACFVLPVEDSLPGIFDSLKHAALIHQSGGGTGFAFSRLRPRNDRVQSTHGVASGPVSFMEVYDAATDAIKQGGARRGANMAILDVHHPDIERFVRAKDASGTLRNFNLSVAVDDAFMQAAQDDGEFALINPRTGQEVGRRDARVLLGLITAQAWQYGDPGLVFLDRVNRDNPTPQLGSIESTNPCGEQPLLPYESCTLGSIDVSKFVTADGAGVEWEALGAAIDVAVRFLDDVIDVNRYPSPEIGRMTLSTRKIGMGVMGFADLLFALGTPYDSEAALARAEELAAFVQARTNAASEALGAERGAFPAWAGSIFDPERAALPQRDADDGRADGDDQHHRGLLGRDRAGLRAGLRAPPLSGRGRPQPSDAAARRAPGAAAAGATRRLVVGRVGGASGVGRGAGRRAWGRAVGGGGGLRHGARGRLGVARADAGGVPATRRQRGVEDDQLPARRPPRGRGSGVHAGLARGLQGDHGLPRRVAGGAGVVASGAGGGAVGRRRGVSRRTARKPGPPILRAWQDAPSNPAWRRRVPGCRASAGACARTGAGGCPSRWSIPTATASACRTWACR